MKTSLHRLTSLPTTVCVLLSMQLAVIGKPVKSTVDKTNNSEVITTFGAEKNKLEDLKSRLLKVRCQRFEIYRDLRISPRWVDFDSNTKSLCKEMIERFDATALIRSYQSVRLRLKFKREGAHVEETSLMFEKNRVFRSRSDNGIVRKVVHLPAGWVLIEDQID